MWRFKIIFLLFFVSNMTNLIAQEKHFFDANRNPASYIAMEINNLSIIPENHDFSTYSNLRKLSIKGETKAQDSSKVQSILNQFKLIDNLQELEIATNYDLSGFSKLHELTWVYNSIFPFFSESQTLENNIQKVTISLDTFSQIPNAIFQFRQAKHLILIGQDLKEEWHPERWNNLKELVQLDMVCYSYFKITPDEEYFPDEILLLPKLQHLNLTTQRSVHFMNIIQNTNLRSLYLNGFFEAENLFRMSPFLEKIEFECNTSNVNIPIHLFALLKNYKSLYLKITLPKATNYDVIHAIEYTIRLNDYKGEKQSISPMKWRRLKKKLLKTYRRDMPAENFYNEYQQIIFKEQ